MSISSPAASRRGALVCVDGRDHGGDAIRFGGPVFMSAQAAAPFLAACPVGSMTTAYVDPRDPADAVLDRESPDPAVRAVLGFGLFFASAGFVGGVAALKRA